jgi:hypothetical protein
MLTMSKERSGVHGALQRVSEAIDDGGWTPVTRKTSRSHRERSNSSGRNEHTHTHNDIVSTPNTSDTESTAHATHEMSRDELAVLVHRQEAYLAQLRAEMGRKPGRCDADCGFLTVRRMLRLWVQYCRNGIVL